MRTLLFLVVPLLLSSAVLALATPASADAASCLRTAAGQSTQRLPLYVTLQSDRGRYLLDGAGPVVQALTAGPAPGAAAALRYAGVAAGEGRGAAADTQALAMAEAAVAATAAFCVVRDPL